MDDIVGEMEKKYGPYTETASYLARFNGSWRGIVAPTGSQTFPMVSRLDYWKQYTGVDLKALFPAGSRDQAKIDQEWTYEKFLGYSQKLQAAGHEIGNPIGQTNDSQVWLGPLFLAFGSQPISADGNVTIDSDETRAAIEYLQQLAPTMPQDVYAWDDAGNNRWIISGRGSANPESTERLGGRRPRCPGGRVPALAPRRPGRAQGPLPRQRAVVLGDLAVRGEQVGGQGSGPVSARQGAVRQADPCGARLRRAPAVELLRQPGVGDRRAAGRHGVQLPGPRQREADRGGLSGGAVRGRPDLQRGSVLGHGRQGHPGGESINDAIAWASDELEGYCAGDRDARAGSGGAAPPNCGPRRIA